MNYEFKIFRQIQAVLIQKLPGVTEKATNGSARMGRDYS
jgi:hypothetical protein